MSEAGAHRGKTWDVTLCVYIYILCVCIWEGMYIILFITVYNDFKRPLHTILRDTLYKRENNLKRSL